MSVVRCKVVGADRSGGLHTGCLGREDSALMRAGMDNTESFPFPHSLLNRIRTGRRSPLGGTRVFDSLARSSHDSTSFYPWAGLLTNLDDCYKKEPPVFPRGTCAALAQQRKTNSQTSLFTLPYASGSPRLSDFPQRVISVIYNQPQLTNSLEDTQNRSYVRTLSTFRFNIRRATQG